MELNDIKQLITTALTDCEVVADGDGRHFEITVISPDFAGKSRVQKQQLVYSALGDAITSGRLHAIALKTFTPDEWRQHNG